MAKVNITVDDRLLERMDNYADLNYMSRSGLVSVAVSQYLNANDSILLIKDMSLAMRKIADEGKIDHDDMEKMEEFMRFSKMITGGI